MKKNRKKYFIGQFLIGVMFLSLLFAVEKPFPSADEIFVSNFDHELSTKSIDRALFESGVMNFAHSKGLDPQVVHELFSLWLKEEKLLPQQWKHLWEAALKLELFELGNKVRIQSEKSISRAEHLLLSALHEAALAKHKKTAIQKLSHVKETLRLLDLSIEEFPHNHEVKRQHDEILARIPEYLRKGR